MKNFKESVEDCTEALKLDNNYMKVLNCLVKGLEVEI